MTPATTRQGRSFGSFVRLGIALAFGLAIIAVPFFRGGTPDEPEPNEFVFLIHCKPSPEDPPGGAMTVTRMPRDVGEHDVGYKDDGKRLEWVFRNQSKYKMCEIVVIREDAGSVRVEIDSALPFRIRCDAEDEFRLAWKHGSPIAWGSPLKPGEHVFVIDEREDGPLRDQ